MSMNRFARFLRKQPVFYALACLPGVCFLIPSLSRDIEYLADPAKYLLEYVGLSATILFVATLALTPLQRIFPKADIPNALAVHRRKLGVASFFYALLHFLIYYVYTGSWGAFVEDWDKPFIISGIVAFSILLLLAITSNNASIRRLGNDQWKRLHRFAYLAMFLLIYHQAAQEKSGFQETTRIFAPLLILQLWRIVLRFKRSLTKASE